MNTSINTMEAGGDKRLPEAIVQTTTQSLTTIQNMQNVQNVVQANLQNIQSTQAIVGSVGTNTSLVGKSISLDLNSKLSLMKPVVPSGITSTVENSKITTTLCSVGSTVRIISPGILNTVEQRQNPQQGQQTSQQTQQIVTNMQATYHVPRGPAAVANISAPRSTVATPIVRASTTGQSVPISRPGISTTVPNTQWQPKTTSVVYAQPQKHPVPTVSRIATRPPTAVYSGQQPRLLTPTNQGRPIQATMVTGVPGTPSRLIAPVLQSNNTVTRLPVVQTRPVTPQIANLTQTTAQPGRVVPSQTLQPNQTSRPLNTTGTINRIAVSAPVIGTANRIAGGNASVTVQPTVGRQLAINTVASTSTGTVSRIVIPQQQVQTQQGAPRVVQTVTSLSNLGTASRVITTTANTSNVAPRGGPPAPTTVARITGMSLHPLPLTPTRVNPTPVKPTQAQTIGQTVQIKSPMQPTTLRVSTSNSNNNITNPVQQSVQGQYLHPSASHSTTYYSVEASGSSFSQYRQTSVQPVRLLVEPTYEEPHSKPNASPRPSILRKRDHDNSPAKGAAKNLVPILTSLPSTTTSPPGSPQHDHDGGGCQSSGSTTVSATSSPGLDEDIEQTRIIINTTVEMSPRKKPRKQQLTGVELTEPKCTEEEMQFIIEEKIKKEIKEEPREMTGDKKIHSNAQRDGKSSIQQPVAIRTRPTASLLGTSWRNRWGGRLHHYKRPSDVRPREERRPTVAELAQQKHVLQKLNGWKVYHLTAQMEDLAELEKQVHEKLKTTLTMLESQQSTTKTGKLQDDGLERANELIKGNMQRSSLISEGMNEARTQLVAIFQHKGHVADILQRCSNKRAQKKRDK